MPSDYGNLVTPNHPLRLRSNTYLPAALAEALVAALPDAAQVEVTDGDGDSYSVMAINKDHVPAIASLLQEIVAYTVASLIDAGSERDAVMENEELTAALEKELMGWTNPFE